MSAPKPERRNEDWRKLLAAYVDDELAEPERRRLESRLESDSDLADELALQIEYLPRNSEFWAGVQPAAPSEDAWAKVWKNVERGIDEQRPRVRGPRNRWWRRGLLAAVLAVTPTAAAAVAIGLAIQPPAAVNPQVAPTEPESIEEPFAVATINDVEILSVRDADASCLVVGESPLNEPITLANSTDVRLDSLPPDWDGQIPQAELGGGAGAPMIFPAADRKP